MQDEHETGKNGVGVARPGASANVECREPQPGTDPGVFEVEPAHRVCGVWNGFRDGWDQGDRVFARAHEQAGSEQRPLRKRLIDCQIMLGENVGVVHVGQDTNDPAALRADARDFNQRIRPQNVPV